MRSVRSRISIRSVSFEENPSGPHTLDLFCQFAWCDKTGFFLLRVLNESSSNHFLVDGSVSNEQNSRNYGESNKKPD